ncbi:LysR substrate-binding domain-containing protein [Streptomyces mirabilis]|uniref:LysR substrate-binding domain-containing protein n=1 Tax=Streptomyces mirabilis TaxID=68239 RepID=UPI0036640021
MSPASPRCPRTTPSRLPPGYGSPTSAWPPEEVDGRAEHDINKHGVHDLAQLVALISLGTTTTVLPKSVAASHLRQGVTYVPVEDCPPATLVIAWPERSRSRGVAALVRAAAAVAQSRGTSTAVEATR